jgi:hypothetical protein
MALVYNGVTITKVVYNGTEIKELIHNGTVVFKVETPDTPVTITNYQSVKQTISGYINV